MFFSMRSKRIYKLAKPNKIQPLYFGSDFDSRWNNYGHLWSKILQIYYSFSNRGIWWIEH